MTDRLGEALANWDAIPSEMAEEAQPFAAIVAAARNWHALTNGEATERIGQAIRDNESVWMRETTESYFVNTDALARLVVDALTDTAEEDA